MRRKEKGDYIQTITYPLKGNEISDDKGDVQREPRMSEEQIKEIKTNTHIYKGEHVIRKEIGE